MTLFAYLLEKLRATPDGDGSLLDHITMMYGAGMADSNRHAPVDLPLVLAGGGAGQLRGGRHIRYPSDTPLANLHLTLLDRFGVHVGSTRRQHRETRRFASQRHLGWFQNRIQTRNRLNRVAQAAFSSPIGEGEVSVNPRTIASASLLVAFLTSAIIVAATTDELIKAVREGNIEVARALLKQRVDVNAPQGDGATALHWAVQLDDLNTVEFLLRAGARADATNDTGVTPLYLACMNRNAVMVDKLLAAGANPNAALLKGETVLMMCARSGNAAAVKALLIHGADVNATEPVSTARTR